MSFVAMMHACSPGESTRHDCSHASCGPYGVDTLGLGESTRQGTHHDDDRGHTSLKPCAVLKELNPNMITKRDTRNRISMGEHQLGQAIKGAALVKQGTSLQLQGRYYELSNAVVLAKTMKLFIFFIN